MSLKMPPQSNLNIFFFMQIILTQVFPDISNGKILRVWHRVGRTPKHICLCSIIDILPPRHHDGHPLLPKGQVHQARTCVSRSNLKILVIVELMTLSIDS